MPVTTPQAMATLVPNLVATAMLGVGVPKLARGLGIGLSQWTPTIALSTTDVGTAGVGKGAPVPVVIPQPVLYGNLLASMVSHGLIGVLAPAFALGLANGLVLLYAQAVTNTTHIGVGVGAGVTTFKPPSAFPAIHAGFAAVGMTGEGSTKLARALSQGLERTFRALVLPQPIVGVPSPTASSGRGLGVII